MNKEIEMALRYFKERKMMCLTDSTQHYEDLAISALEAQQADTWIPVSSGRTPEIPQNWIDDGFNRVAILATSDGEDMSVIRWYDIEVNYFFKDYDSLESVDYGISAWKTLDEPWKEINESKA